MSKIFECMEGIKRNMTPRFQIISEEKFLKNTSINEKLAKINVLNAKRTTVEEN